MKDPILSWLESERDSMLSLLRQFVEHESPSNDKRALDGFGHRLADELKAEGAL